MKNMQAPDGYSEPGKHVHHKLDTRHYVMDTGTDHMMLDYLLNSGFLWDEAITLLNLREHLYENAEMRQRITDDYRMQFVKWLFEQKMVSDDC
jgi:hypothetical protein